MLNDYQKQAIVWDWDGYDNTPEFDYWCEYADKYGKNVLVPMCAHGQIGAHMATNGFHVVAFDITSEMISEGKRRYGSVNGLELVIADILDLNLYTKDFDFTFIAGNGDLHLLQTVQEIERAFCSINRHLRIGGCLALEITLPSETSWSYPKRIYHPRKPNYTDKRVWKENEGMYNADEKRHYINQTVYIEDMNGTEHFIQHVCLQYYDREVILNLLDKCGFAVKNEYSNRENKLWKPGEHSWIIETIKETGGLIL